MRPFIHRLVISLATGYIFMYFSELLFWAQPLMSFALYSLLVTVGAMCAYGVLLRWPIAAFTPSWIEYLVAGGIVTFFLAVAVIEQQLLVLAVFLPLIIVTLLFLARARSRTPVVAGARGDSRPPSHHVFAVLLIPAWAAIMYGGAQILHLIVPVNIVWYLVTMPLGFLAYLWAALSLLRQRRITTMTAALYHIS